MLIRWNRVSVAIGLSVLLTNLSCNQGGSEAKAAPSTNPLHGVWSVTKMSPSDGGSIDPSQPGLFIFTEDHYSAVYSLGADPRPLSNEAFAPTSDEKVAQYDTIIVNTGTYEADGSTITFHPTVAKSPEFIGGRSTMKYQISGDMLQLTASSVVSAAGDSAPLNGPGSTMSLQRIE